MKEFMEIQVGDKISFQAKNSQKKGILLNKKYRVKDIFNVNEYGTNTYTERDWKCIAFIGEDKRRVVFRNNIKNFNSYKFTIYKKNTIKLPSLFQLRVNEWFRKKEDKRVDECIEFALYLGVKEDTKTLEKKYKDFCKRERKNYLQRKKYAKKRALELEVEYFIDRYKVYKKEQELKKKYK